MTILNAERISNNSKLWMIAFTHRLSQAEIKHLQAALLPLLDTWAHKGHAYQPSYDFLWDQILIITEETMASQPSGCAIDGFMNRLRKIFVSMNLNVHDSANSILIYDEPSCCSIPKIDLEKAFLNKSISSDSSIIDLSLETMEQLRLGLHLKPIQESWVGKKYSSFLQRPVH